MLRTLKTSFATFLIALLAGLGLLGLSSASLAQSSATAPKSATYGLHGMLLFGNSEGLYASHLPMFHAPHDYQVVLQVRLANRQLETQIKKDLEKKLRLWTIEPEQFDIAQLAPGANPALHQFKANIVLGHFEQGGKTRYKNVLMVVEQALLFRQLSPALHQSEVATYRQIGSGRQRFLLKEIDSRPDYDHVIAISTAAHASTQNLLIKKSGIDQPDRTELQSALQKIAGSGARLKANIYFDHADLE
ncbi:hypothetical protein LPB67_00615 [Undibacterium sp. Jales W-56]|uniref:hypothetical protein n=1 Tax=Undibacterium sp. Jales W-56 TaxID=2897325 RepID=UPI0021D27975|nr:hypothetical protein [Undibacterium sp. Jales W-56]MCU6432275.1 hypothetical protein [Undibacterium sp. Jales W-56]